MRFTILAMILSLAACTTPREAGGGAEPVAVKVIAFNDFHGNLEPPRQALSLIHI